MASSDSTQFNELPIKEVIKDLPNSPGVYRYYDRNKTILYVGKAKDLKKRVSSYFTNKYNDRKTASMISKIRYVQYTVVNSESDALLLENSLIKSEQPKYNILLRDDKTFPFICLTEEEFPKIITTRRLHSVKGTYFGPFASVSAMKTMVEFLRKTFNIRTCNLPLSEKSIKKNKFKLCLEYHLGNCLAPCEGLQSRLDYTTGIEQARLILKGNTQPVRLQILNNIQIYSDNLEFEKAQWMKKKLDRLDRHQSKSVIANPQLGELDVFTIINERDKAFINFIKVNQGTIIHTENFKIDKKLNESEEDILTLIIPQVREKYQSNSSEVLINTNIDFLIKGLDIHQPKIGDKKKLVELSLKNLNTYKNTYLINKKELNEKLPESLYQLQTYLKLNSLPLHIECFDNSNLQGTSPVAAMVCFKKGIPSKKEYRHYHIKTVEGPDDFSSMKEVVHRRYSRILEESGKLPDLIVIDGGKGQLNAAKEALILLDIYGQIPIIGIAKRLEEIYFPEDSEPIHFSKKSPALILLQHIRNEAHRFAITFHRNMRSKKVISPELTSIKGIGTSTINTLLKHFKTTQKIKNASESDLNALIGVAKSRLVLDYLKSKKGA